MSTRCTITVRDTEEATEAYSIYRHSDGYPDTEHGVIAALTDALPYAWKLPRFEAADFAAGIVAAWKKPAGPKYGNYARQGGFIYGLIRRRVTSRHAANLTTGRDAHGDTEFHYEVFQRKGAVIVQCFVPRYDADGRRVWVRKGRDHVIG